jgi:hypothetical protein
MLYPIDDSTPEAKKARALLTCVVELAEMDADVWCFFTKKVIWGLSLYLELGNFRVANWLTYPRISDAARTFRDARKPGSKWTDKVTFDHVRTLHDMEVMLKSATRSVKSQDRALKIEKAAEIIGEYPPMLITEDQDRGMRERKPSFKWTGVPEERYLEIPFTGFTLRSAGFAVSPSLQFVK